MMEPDTPAIQALGKTGVEFTIVQTERPSSVEESARLQGIDPGSLLRTIVIRRGEDDYVFVLVPGGREIDWPKLRAHLGVRRLSLPDQEEARSATGYEREPLERFEDDLATYYHDVPRELADEALRRSRNHPSPAAGREPWPLAAMPRINAAPRVRPPVIAGPVGGRWNRRPGSHPSQKAAAAPAFRGRRTARG